MHKLLFTFFLAFSACSPGQKSLIGEWKLNKVTVLNSLGHKTYVYYDRKNQESIKEKLFKQHIQELASDSEVMEEESNEKIDTLNFKHTLDIEFLKYDSAKITFKSDSTILISSFGLISPTAVPGWHFGDKVGGRWTQQKNKLKFMIGDSKTNYPCFYKISKQTSDSLILDLVGEDYEDVIMILEFVRQ